jgi:signal peptidase I
MYINNAYCGHARPTNRIREDPPKGTEPLGRKPPLIATILRELGSLAIRIGAVAAVAALVFTFVYGLHYNVDPTMNPLVRDGDLVIYSRLDKDYKAKDLLLLSFEEQTQIRRVVATAGDKVDIAESGLIINGALQQERDIFRITQQYIGGIDFPVTLEEGEVFVLGDAREGVIDSRVYGTVNTEDTLGKVITIVRRRNL